MRCYITGEECDCGNEMDEQCPHDVYTPEDDEEAQYIRDAHDALESEHRFEMMSEQLDRRWV